MRRRSPSAATEETSGRRDLNPRPVAAATGLRIQLRQLIAAAAGLVVSLLSCGIGSGPEVLAIEYKPWNSVSCRFRMTGVVPAQTIVKVLTRSDIMPARLAAPKYIDMEHI